MNRYERKLPRTTIGDLDPRRAIRSMGDHELRLVTGGFRGGCIPMTTDVAASDDVPRG